VANKSLVIVESPAKATKIAGYLGSSYVVESSRGHVRDLPTSAASVPEKHKKEPWARTGVNIADNFTPLYVVNADKRATIKKLKDELKNCDELLLATDEDREGEAIAWHLLQELKPKVPVKRMVFHEITPQAIQAAVSAPRELDMDLVDAQETRRILDRLYGYEVSPVLWKKVMPKLSAGRVQSVATRLIVDRERERIAFVPAGYSGIIATCETGDGDFQAKLTTLGGTRVAQGRDFDASGKAKASVLVLGEAAAKVLATALKQANWQVANLESKPFVRRPAAPFRTTTLQQEAGRKLGFTTQRTMSVAQDLYEGGYITYMRTDSVALSDQAISAARAQIKQLFGNECLPAKPRVYASKVKNAQEAHEAIRPAGDSFQTPAQTGLMGEKLRLYELVWQRTVASQMADATGRSLSVTVTADLASPVALDGGASVQHSVFAASGQTIEFAGFRKVYVETDTRAETSGEDDTANATLPPLTVGQALKATEVTPEDHATKPPARFTEPSLVAKLEELEIGRPSTYASIIRTITERDYVFKRGTALVPTWLAFAVTRLLEQHFSNLVDYAFTAELEDKLDEIANGEIGRLAVLSDFYFGSEAALGLDKLVNNLGEIDAKAISTIAIGEGINVRVGRYGAYVEDADAVRGNIPESIAPDELTVEVAKELLSAATSGNANRALGTDPHTGYVITARDGRYGPYVTEELPEDTDKKVKARTASLFKTMNLGEITLDDALKLLTLPRVVGVDDDTEIVASNGRYGPYIQKGKDSRSLTDEEQLLTITLDEAKALLAQPKTYGRTRTTGAASAAAKVLGDDPETGKPISVKEGRFGPYVTDGETNATLRRGDSPDTIDLTRAAELLAEKRAKGPSTTTKRKTTAKKPAAKKTTTKKPAAK
jgi:DNA topoisomerase-1